RDENRKLRDYPTLAHVIRFVYEKRPDLDGAASAKQVERAVEVPGENPAQITQALPAVVAVSAAPEVAKTFAKTDSVKERILALVVEKTGYPQDMLDLDLDLEADLGVDTVKQAEMFAAIREIYNIPRDENRKLRDYPTLAHVIRFVYEKRPDLAEKAVASPAAAPPATAVAVTAMPDAAEDAGYPPTATALPGGTDPVKDRIIELVVEKTGYPKDMLDLDLDLEADLGVDTVKQAEMFAAIREIYNIPRDENRKLRDYPTLAHVIRFVYENRPDLAGVPTPKPTIGPESPVAEVVASTSPAIVTYTAPGESVESIRDKVLQIVAEKTGYPPEMLDLDLDLEADLGIDTVKQAEMFAAVRAAYEIPRDESLKLRDFPTLAHVIQFAEKGLQKLGRLPVQPAAGIGEKAGATAEPPTGAGSGIARPAIASFDAANQVPRRVPVPVLRPPLSLCKPTGVKLGSGRRVVVMPDNGGTADALVEQLTSLGDEVLRIENKPNAESLTRCVQGWRAAGPVHGVYWLPALDKEAPLGDMDAATWREALRVRVKSLYTTMRVLYEQIAAPGTFLMSASRLGGQHGYDEAGAVAPMGGAVTGFTKSYKRERAEALVKTVDFEVRPNASEIAELLIEETLRDPGAVEVGYKNGLRWSVGLQEQPAEDGRPGLTLDRDSVFLVTGAAGSIVSAITADLASASGGTFYLLDLVPEPDANNPDLPRLSNDREALKRDIFARIQARGERATPALVEKELAALERARAALSAIDA
ncbi:MAG TPA: phosphopantetheine-binding protein, partial [Candidatus Methylomirabilis sp.]|nr:phosphopantetheine-binding protein [Candidatus Methylomirabilis sp.]